MWAGFDGRGYTREQWMHHVAETPLMPGACGVTEHATGVPSLAQAVAMNPANYVKNTQTYYENSLHWQHGPHAFSDLGDGETRPAIWGFSSLSVRGTHCSCDNLKPFYGLEAMGNRNTEDYSTGPGAMALANQHFAIACLFVRMGLKPTPATYVPHSHCAADGHFQCPHENWERDWRDVETAAIVAFMNALGAVLPVNAYKAAQAVPLYPAGTLPLYGSVAWSQDALNAWIAKEHPANLVALDVDNDYGGSTRDATKAYQTAHHLTVDGVPGAQTNASLKFYL